MAVKSISMIALGELLSECMFFALVHSMRGIVIEQGKFVLDGHDDSAYGVVRERHVQSLYLPT